MSTYHEEDEPLHRQLDVALWRRMIVHARPYRRPLMWLSVAGLVVATCDVLLPRFAGAVVDDAIAGNAGQVWMDAAMYLGTVSVLATMVWFFIGLAGVAATGVAYDLRRAAFGKLQELSFSF